jgi:hypothetical protein
MCTHVPLCQRSHGHFIERFQSFLIPSGLAQCVKGGGVKKEKGHKHPILSLAFTSPFWERDRQTSQDLGSRDLRSVRFFALPCPSLVLRNAKRNETRQPEAADLVVASSQLCDLQIACLKSSFPCIFSYFEQISFVFCFWTIT